MFSSLVGMVDTSAAVVLVAMFAGMTAVLLALAWRRSRRMVETDFDLAKIKSKQDHERAQYTAETDRLVKLETAQGEREVKLEQTRHNLLTSHAKDITPGANNRRPEREG